MSCMYYRVDPTPLPPMTFGFRKVEDSELEEIIKRLTKPTYNSQLQKDNEQRYAHNYVYLRQNNPRRRTPSACSKRRPATAPCSSNSNRQISERDIQRIFRRMQMQTQSSINRTFDDNDKIKFKDLFVKDRQPTRDQIEKAKAFERLRHPTTASRAKSVKDCPTCSDHQLKSKFDLDVPLDYKHADKRGVNPEELEFIIERVRTTTFASMKSKEKCRRLPSRIDEVKIREKLPLVSGLARSKNVNEIVERLSTKRHSRTPQATEVTVQ